MVPPPSPIRRLIIRHSPFIISCCLPLLAVGQSVVINELSSAQSDRVLQFNVAGVSHPGCLTQWTDLGYDRSYWKTGPGPLGFGYGGEGTSIPNMIGKAVSFYLRREFTPTAAQLGAGDPLQIVIDYDDGFVAYLNGIEIARRNLGAVNAYAYADAITFNSHPAGTPETITLAAASSLLRSGVNVLAIQVHNNAYAEGTLALPNTAAGGGKMKCDAALKLNSTTPQTLVASTDAWQYFTGLIEPSAGLFDHADPIVASPLALPPAPNWAQITFDDTAWPTVQGALGYDTTLTGSNSYVPQLGTNTNSILTAMKGSSISVFGRRTFTLTQAQYDAITSLTLTVDWDDGYALFLNGGELSRANLGGTAGALIPWNTAATDHGAAADFTPNDPTRKVSLAVDKSRLRVGNNVIASQLHNSFASSVDLLLDLQFSAATPTGPLVFVQRNDVWRYFRPTSEIGSMPAVPSIPVPELSDWIELKNVTAAAVSLAGWTLTDDAAVAGKWVFPAWATIPANGYLVVLASGKNITAPAGGVYLHTNFSLSSSGEYLALRDASGTLISKVTNLPNQDYFHTWGIDPSSGVYRYLPLGTPGATNAAGTAIDQVQKVDMNHETGYYPIGTTVSLTCPTPGATIRYTTDGTEPTDTVGTLYTVPFNPVVKVVVGPGAGNILREVWQNNGTYITPPNLPVNTMPTLLNLITSFEVPSGYGDFYGTRVRGFLHPPSTGSYIFRLATDDDGELWLGTSADPASKVRIASIAGWAGVREWGKYPSQTSVAINLVAGQRYYVEMRFSEGGGGDNGAVAWTGPGFSAITVIEGRYLSPPDVLPAGVTQLPGGGGVRARAFLPGWLPSDVRSRSFITGADARVQNFPAIFLSGDPGRTFYAPNGIFTISGGAWNGGGDWGPTNAGLDYDFCLMHGGAWERPAQFEYVSPGNVVDVRTTLGLRFSGSVWSRTKYTNTGLESGAWNSGWTNKPQMALHFRGELGDSTLHLDHFLPTSKLNDWDTLKLRAGKNDPYNPFIIDEFVRRTFGAMGNPSPQGIFATGYLNGDLKGYFNLCERPLEKYWQEYFNTSSTWDVTPNDWSANLFTDTDWQSGDSVAWRTMMTYFKANDFSVLANYQTGTTYWDVKNVADYYIINGFTGMQDWPGNNFYFAHERIAGGKWWFSMWDAEGAFGTFGQANTINEFDSNLLVPENGSRNPAMTGDDLTTRLMLRRFYQSPEFRMVFADRLQKHFFNGGPLSTPVLTGLHDTMKTQISPIIKAVNGGDYWDGWWTDWVVASGRTNTFLTQCRTLGMWPVTTAPVFNRSGGTIAPAQPLVISQANGSSGFTTFVTTNGTDPRAVGGAVAGSVYSTPLTITTNTSVKARVRNNSTLEWSPITEGSFAPPPPALAFTEINYNPPGSGDATEFLEITNIGGGTAVLNGAHFTAGVTYAFTTLSLTAGQSVVLVKDPAAFAAMYPGVAIGGVFGGSLNNSGDTLTLVDFAEQTIATVTYGDSNVPGWPTAPDGNGGTLVLMRPWLNPSMNNPANWRTSDNATGHPGAADSMPLIAASPMADADADGFSALVEYALGTSDAAAGARPVITTSNVDGEYTCSVTRPINADEAIVQALESPNLNTWTAAEKISEVPVTNGMTTTTWRCLLPSTSGRIFIKLQATLRP